MADVQYLGYVKVEHDYTIHMGGLFPKRHFELYPDYIVHVPTDGKIHLEPIWQAILKAEDGSYFNRAGVMYIPQHSLIKAGLCASKIVDIHWNRDNNSIDIIRTSAKIIRLNEKVAEKEQRIWYFE